MQYPYNKQAQQVMNIGILPPLFRRKWGVLLFFAATLFSACKKTPLGENRSGVANTLTSFVGKDIYYNKLTGHIELSGINSAGYPARYTFTKDWKLVDSTVYTSYTSPPYWSNYKFVETKGGNTFFILCHHNYDADNATTTIQRRNAAGSYITTNSNISYGFNRVLNDVIPSKDGGFMLLFGCATNSLNLLYDTIAIRKYNEQGALVQSLDLSPSSYLQGFTIAMSVAEKANGNYLVYAYGIEDSTYLKAGIFNSDVLYEITPQGNFVGAPHFFKKELHGKGYGGFWSTRYGKVFVMPDGSLRLASTYIYADEHIVVRKMNAAGMMEWERQTGRPGKGVWLGGAFIDRRGYLVCSGWEMEGAPPLSPFMFRMDDAGNILWQQYYPNTSGSAGGLISDVICTEGEDAYFMAHIVMYNATLAQQTAGDALHLYRINPANGQLK